MKRHGWWLTAGALALGLGFAPQLRAELAPGPNDAPRPSHQEEVRRQLEQLRQHAASLASALPRPPGSGEAAAPSSSAAAPSNPLALELAKKWADIVATRHERRERHRAELAQQLGARVSDPAVLAEVKLHTTRQAELARASFLAQNARQGAQRDKILQRIAKLSERENQRHRGHMDKLLGRTAAPSSSAPSAALSATPGTGGPR